MRDKLKSTINNSLIPFMLRKYDPINTALSKPYSIFAKYSCYFLSPTWLFAKISSKELGKEEHTKILVIRNHFYLLTSIFLFILVGFCMPPGVLGNKQFGIGFILIFTALLWMIPFSRCNEIFFAFIKDALEKTSGDEAKSNLTYRKRIELSFLSYLELILNYSILYYVMPLSWFGEESSGHFSNIIDALYFSGVTITTLGYGDFSPVNALPKLLVLEQVLVGFTLIIVSFAIYAGKGLSLKKPNKKIKFASKNTLPGTRKKPRAPYLKR